jgi:hypothetical protein
MIISLGLGRILISIAGRGSLSSQQAAPTYSAVRFSTRAKQLARSFRTAQNENHPFQGWLVLAVRNARIELAISAWEADVIPLN